MGGCRAIALAASVLACTGCELIQVADAIDRSADSFPDSAEVTVAGPDLVVEARESPQFLVVMTDSGDGFESADIELQGRVTLVDTSVSPSAWTDIEFDPTDCPEGVGSCADYWLLFTTAVVSETTPDEAFEGVGNTRCPSGSCGALAGIVTFDRSDEPGGAVRIEWSIEIDAEDVADGELAIEVTPIEPAPAP